jgi:hypothetical protein
MIGDPLLKNLLIRGFVEMYKPLASAICVTLGRKVGRTLRRLGAEGLIDRTKVLDGLGHPSPANSERIAYVLGEKTRSALSSKTDADVLDAGIERFRRDLAALTAARHSV